MKDLVGKTAFVTGAASGIGLGIAAALARAGAKVMLCDIEEAALAKAVEGFEAHQCRRRRRRGGSLAQGRAQAAAEATIAH
jgi:NAD(P)-dependent dehydrogenase (short-subunit alcohol dehydrogenase family)